MKMNNSANQSSSRQARIKAGGKAVHTILPTDAATALGKLYLAGYASTIGACIAKALIEAIKKPIAKVEK